MKRILSMVMMIVITVTSFGFCSYNSNSVVSADTVSWPSGPELVAETAVMIDASTGSVLFDKKCHQKMYPASITKIMTALLTIENCNLDDTVTFSQSAIDTLEPEAANIGAVVGEEMSVKDCLYALMLQSANEVASALAEHVSGSIEEFAKLMNQKALEIGCKNTHFTNPSGIHDENHYTTAYDLSLIAKYCMQNSVFRSIVSEQSCTINSTNKSDVRKYSNTNDLINPSSKYYLKECVGIKTGYTALAKNCLISACSKNNLGLICVVLGANQMPNGESSRYLDSIHLFKYGYANYSVRKFVDKDVNFTNIEIKNGNKDTRSLDLYTDSSVSGLLKNTDSIPEGKIELNNTISAPISKGSVIGSVTYTVGDNSYSTNLVASHDVEEDEFLLFVFKIVLGIVLFLILTTLLFSKSKKKK